MEIRAVLFDLDNTLFDHAASARAGLDAFLQHLGTEPADNELVLAWFAIEHENYNRYLAKEITFFKQRRERLRQFLPLAGLAVPGTERLLDELFATYLRNYEDSWQAFPDAAPSLQRLRDGGIRVAVITNGNHDQQMSKIKKAGLEPLLDRTFSSESTGHAKPSPEAFTRPCKSLGISPAKALYVGDNFRVDVEGARNAGLQALHLRREGTAGHGTIQNLGELIPLLQTGTLS